MTRIDHEAVARFAEAVRAMPDMKPLDFYHTFDGKAHDAAMYPELENPLALEFFFFACLHQYGFWHGDRYGYRSPMFATFEDKKVKGSDALWMSLKRALDAESAIFLPERLARITEHEMWERLFVDDTGRPFPFPDPTTRLEMTRAYGARLSGIDFTRFLRGNAGKRPLASFLEAVTDVPGFGDDPLRKKARLLAMILMNRPEGFLIQTGDEVLPLLVDYHLMRVALRLGLIDLDEGEREANRLRRWTDQETEDLVRRAVHDALTEVQRLSGVSSAKLDLALWSARRYCPEMTEPECGKCRFESVCAKRTELFQPVFRTTAY